MDFCCVNYNDFASLHEITYKYSVAPCFFAECAGTTLSQASDTAR